MAELSLWLQPEPAAAAELDAVIARLAARYGTATFPAHLTVLTGLPPAGPAGVAALARLADSLPAPDVRFGELRCEQSWRRSLYLAAVPHPRLQAIFEAAVRVFGVPVKPAFEPHLSLQYSELPVADKLRLAADAELELPRTVRLDRVSLWQTPGSDATRWRLLADRPLDAG